MKNIYKKINVSFFFLLLILLSLISGLFRDILCLFLIIIIHEVGHVITSLIYGWNIKKIDITVCGGFITYDDVIDKPFKEEFFIAISGILMQSFFYVFCLVLKKLGIISLDTILLIRKYHYAIFLFNLLPVVPLDGAKVVNILLNVFLPYKKALKLTNVISLFSLFCIFFIFILFGIKIEYGYLIILSFVISKLIRNIKDVPFLFNRFLFERYKCPIKINKYTYIKTGNIGEMRRQRKNYFYINGKYCVEKLILAKRFD